MNRKPFSSWANLFALTILSIYLYLGLEWIFFATKPSFLNALPFLTQVGILALSGLALSVICAAALALLAAAGLLFHAAGAPVLRWLGGLVPAVFFACAALLFVDNFSYTVFKFGIVKTSGLGRGVYALLFLLFLGRCLVWVVERANRPVRAADGAARGMIGFSAALILLSIPLGVSQFLTGQNAAAAQVASAASRKPNILLIGSDGLDANHMSLYGYSRDTTPFLKEFAKTSLLSENNFPNATLTTGSLVSIFTGKLPTTTRVLYPPDILKGSDTFEHLPGLLKSAGYFTADITVDYYGNSTELNMQNSFVMTNGRTLVSGKLYNLLRRALPDNESYFLSILGTRLTDRLLHIFYIQKMADPYAEVTQILSTVNDQDRIQQILYTFKHSPQPLFLHVHMMGTHEGNVDNQTSTFSQGKVLSRATEWDFYDDAIVDFDGYLKQVVGQLSQMGILENTVIIVYTDHGFFNVSNVRIPLLFHFPGGEHAGRLVHNTQNLDIAPTLLDYLGIRPPAWMAGLSLLKGEPPAARPIFSAAPGDRYHDDGGRLQIDRSKLKPPFYQFRVIGMVICHKVYTLDTATFTWQAAGVAGYDTPCPAGDLPGEAQAHKLLLDQLKRDGFQLP